MERNSNEEDRVNEKNEKYLLINFLNYTLKFNHFTLFIYCNLSISFWMCLSLLAAGLFDYFLGDIQIVKTIKSRFNRCHSCRNGKNLFLTHDN